ncbi:hypothetical protein WDW86_05515 [Bdellovibrionota bacterium FG-2]
MKILLLTLAFAFPVLIHAADPVKPRTETYWKDTNFKIQGLPWGSFYEDEGKSKFFGYYRNGKFSDRGTSYDGETQCSFSVEGSSYEAVTNAIYAGQNFRVSQSKDLMEKDVPGFWDSVKTGGVRNALAHTIEPMINGHHQSRIYLLFDGPPGVRGELICEVHSKDNHALSWSDVKQALGGTLKFPDGKSAFSPRAEPVIAATKSDKGSVESAPPARGSESAGAASAH